MPSKNVHTPPKRKFGLTALRRQCVSFSFIGAGRVFSAYVKFWCSSQLPLIKVSGISICHPIYDDKAMTSALQDAIYSAILNTEATATF
eukprot:1156868-Pelagomonas_calceolata.AAC.1